MAVWTPLDVACPEKSAAVARWRVLRDSDQAAARLVHAASRWVGALARSPARWPKDGGLSGGGDGTGAIAPEVI